MDVVCLPLTQRVNILQTFFAKEQEINKKEAEKEQKKCRGWNLNAERAVVIAKLFFLRSLFFFLLVLDCSKTGGKSYTECVKSMLFFGNDK